MVFRVVGERGACYFFQAELPYDVQTYPYSGALEAITVVCCVRACVCVCTCTGRGTVTKTFMALQDTRWRTMCTNMSRLALGCIIILGVRFNADLRFLLSLGSHLRGH